MRRARNRKRCSAEEFLTRVACRTGMHALPFLADAVEAIGAQLELLAQPPQYRGFHSIVLLFECAGDVVRALALLTVVDEVILVQNGLQTAESLRIDAGPKQGEVADVAVKFAASSPLG